MKRLIKRLILICVPFMAACSSSKKVVVDLCPNILADDSMLESSYFVSGKPAALENEKYRVKINEALLDCVENDGRLTARIEPEFLVAKGMAYDGEISFSYYIAAADNDKKIIAKKIYEYKSKNTMEKGFSLLSDNNGVTIDVMAKDKEKYTFYIGLQMNEQQLEYNRSKKSWLN